MSNASWDPLRLRNQLFSQIDPKLCGRYKVVAREVLIVSLYSLAEGIAFMLHWSPVGSAQEQGAGSLLFFAKKMDKCVVMTSIHALIAVKTAPNAPHTLLIMWDKVEAI